MQLNNALIRFVPNKNNKRSYKNKRFDEALTAMWRFLYQFESFRNLRGSTVL